MMKLSPCLFFMALVLLAPMRAQAETTQCTTIESLPVTISTQGIYCLKKNLSTAITQGNAITVATNNVTIDCNNFKIGGLAAGDGTEAHGIGAVERSNITVRNCSIRGFYRGIALDGAETSSGHMVVDNILDGNTYLGIRVGGDGGHIRGNRVVNTGGTTQPFGTYGGIILHGQGGYVADNDVANLYQADAVNGPPSGDGSLKGIVVSGYRNVVEGNRLSNIVPAANGRVLGIWLTLDSNQALVSRNSIIMVPGTAGAPVADPNGGSNGDAICRDNTASGFDPSFLTSNTHFRCADFGGNVGLYGD